MTAAEIAAATGMDIEDARALMRILINRRLASVVSTTKTHKGRGQNVYEFTPGWRQAFDDTLIGLPDPPRQRRDCTHTTDCPSPTHEPPCPGLHRVA